MLAVVLAAGRGSRLLPLTKHRSKGMMPVAGKPMIARILEMLGKGGAESFIVVAHPADRGLPTYLAGSHWATTCRVVYQERRLGMAHAVECASGPIRAMNAREFVLASCDNLYPEGHVANLLARYLGDGLDGAVTLMWTPPERATASAVAVLQGNLVADIIEKPSLKEIPSCNARGEALSVPSLYVLSSDVLDYLHQVTASPRGEREFPDALRLLIADGGKIGGQRVSDRMTLTTPKDLLALNRQILQSDPTCATVDAEVPDDTTILPPVRIEAGARVASGCYIGPDTYLESGCRVGANAVVRRAVVMRGGHVERNSVAEASVISSAGRVL